ncbi:MAG: SNF2 helicase associated domain-containing protein [Lachnospiraceae bacterium]|nr:SNF2 helicase associated domain-containing protein [Lachnospiraceae bacterium]
MNWKYLFDRDVLAEGRRLYVDGAVTLLPGMKGGFLANVLDDGVYQVSVTVSDDAVAAISCTCRAGRAGRRCRHMSAALYEVDALSDKLEEVKTQLENEDASSMDERVEFPASEAEGYQYFRLSRILKDAWITRGQLKRARDLVEQGRIRMIRFQADYHAQGRMAVTCYGELSGGDTTGSVLYDMVQGIKSARSYSDISRVFTRRGAYQDLVRVEFDAQQVLSHSCQNYNCARRQAAGLGGSMARRREEYCDHEIALMMLAQERLDRENPGDATDENAAGLLAAFRSLRREGEDVARTVKLEPRLVLSQGSLKLSMRVGTGKMFVVRNLPAFAAAVRGADKISLGTSEEIDFAVQRFTPEAESYFELVEEFVQADAGASGDGAFYRGLGSNIGKDVVLGGVMLDRFFEAAAGREISLQEEGSSGSRKNKVRLTEGEPELHFHIRRMLDSYGEFHGIELSGKMPHLLQGSRYAYYLEKDRLCRISPETRRKLRPLSQLEENGEIRLRIGRNHLAAFYRDVLPKLRTAAVITEEDPEETQTFLPPSAEFLFYVDGEEESASCRPVVRYGTEEFDLKPGEDVSASKLRDSWAEESALRVVQQYFPEWNAEAGVFETQEDGLYRLVEEGF